MNKRLLISSTLLLGCVIGAVNFSGIATAEGDHCGVEYDKNLKTDFSLANGTVTIKNTSDDCNYDVGMASYKVYYGKSKHSDSWLETQTLYDSKTTHIGKKDTVSMQVSLPDCRYQVDVFRGSSVVTEFERGSENNESGYKDRLVAAGINDSKPLCSSDQPTPTPVPTKPVTPTPTVKPTTIPTPTTYPTATPTKVPTVTPTKYPTATPTKTPSVTPTNAPSATPTTKPSVTPTTNPSHTPTPTPTCTPTPTVNPSHTPTPTPTNGPSATPTPTANPSHTPTPTPTNGPSATPTVTPTNGPTATPTPTGVTTPSATPTPQVLSTTKGGQPVYEVKGITTTPQTGPETLALFALLPSAAAGLFLRKKGSK